MGKAVDLVETFLNWRARRSIEKEIRKVEEMDMRARHEGARQSHQRERAIEEHLDAVESLLKFDFFHEDPIFEKLNDLRLAHRSEVERRWGPRPLPKQPTP